MNDLVRRLLDGDVRAAARIIRAIDDRQPEARDLLKALYPSTGRAYVIGVTGAPGVGKSTLVDRMVDQLRKLGKTVGVLAVDPTSPFTGGAILGDRIRMQRHCTDEGVFIRSMATRGHFGGLSQSTRSAIDVLDAMGKDVVLVETVGVGQDEIEVVATAHTTIITVVPGMGDDIQAIKAGILEVGDLFVINKCERQGADRTLQELNMMLEMEGRHLRDEGWRPPVIKTEAVTNTGIDRLMTEIENHRRYLYDNDRKKLNRRLRSKFRTELLDQVKLAILERLLGDIEKSGELDRMVDELVARTSDPYTVCDRLVQQLMDR
ncbi:MAG: methylmalonyl Co-A mutase-associated GTPase MeaB [Deltaproteobacteria bacterium]|nr:methylmalonyl Co-A mutase-associated GTPase MeaB [Deltaproteobacteria bacterium]